MIDFQLKYSYLKKTLEVKLHSKSVCDSCPLVCLSAGSGDKLGDIPRTCLQITKMKPADLKPLHTILFDRPGKVQTSAI